MTLFVGQASNLKRQRASQAAGFAALAIATMAYIGRWVSLPLLSSWGSGFATVKPTTALCLIALSLALVHPGKSSRLAFAISLAVAAIAALDLIDRFSIDSGINHLNRLLVPLAHPLPIGDHHRRALIGDHDGRRIGEFGRSLGRKSEEKPSGGEASISRLGRPLRQSCVCPNPPSHQAVNI